MRFLSKIKSPLLNSRIRWRCFKRTVPSRFQKKWFF